MILWEANIDGERKSLEIICTDYSSLHFFLWGLCKDSEPWKIDPFNPELMGNNWIIYPWKIEEYDSLLDLLEELHLEISTTILEDTFVVKSTGIILPVNEEEILTSTLRDKISQDIFAVRIEEIIFDVQEQLDRINTIYSFVKDCQRCNAEIRIVKTYAE